MNKKQPKQPQSDRIILPRGFRLVLFFLLTSIEFATQNSSGLLSSASKDIKETLHMNDKEFGMFGTVTGLGRVLGSSLFIFLVNNFSRKSILIFFVFVKACLLFCFKLTSVGYLLILTRFFIGIVHMPLTIYIPIWIDQFAISKYKTLFMTILQVAMPTGKVAGYLLHIIFGENNWQMGFVFEGCYLSFVGFVVFCVPSNYFSANLFVAKPNDDLKHKLVLNAKRSSNVTEFQFISSTQDKAVAQQKEKKSTFFEDMKDIIINFVFINSVLVRAILFGVNTALHFWISDYMRSVLFVEDKRVIFVSYTIIAVSGPIGGVLASSIVSKFLGGYEHKNSAYILLFLHCMTCCIGLFIPFMKQLYPFCFTTTLYLVFSSSALPIVQGIIITSVSAKLKGTAFSIANLVQILLTSGPAPFLYGVINDAYKHVFPGMAMLCIMSCACVGIVFIVFLIVARHRMLNRVENDNERKFVRRKTRKLSTSSIADDIAGAVNDTSLEMNASIDRSREEFGMQLGDSDSEDDVEMEMKE